MQQYFTGEKLSDRSSFVLDDEALYHMTKVLRKKDGYNFRVIDSDSECYLCSLYKNEALIIRKIDEDHELDIDVTVIMSLIKMDKFEMALQKMTELGVKRIVPYAANRSVVKIKDENHKLERFRKIVREAAEQSHRDIIPEITEVVSINDIDRYLSVYNFVAYEKHDGMMMPFGEVSDSLSVVIGPEGGFELSEIEALEKAGFECYSLGRRILRAETAAMFVMANITGVFDR